MERHEPPRWRGVNHLAMITPDMDETVRFYHGVLGMRLVATLSAGPMRHYFFELGPQNTIAFFEWSRAETFAKAAGMPTLMFPMQFDHLSFNLLDEDAPLMGWIYRDDERRRRLLPKAFTFFLTRWFLRHGETYMHPDGVGGAVWCPPGTWRITAAEMVRGTPAMVRKTAGYGFLRGA